MQQSIQKSGWDLAEEGIQVSFNFANSDWKEAAASAVRLTAQELPLFTVDDVYARIEKMVQTQNTSALGQIMRNAAKEGLIEKTAGYQRSARPQRHSAPQPVWKSLVFSGV
jgi:hypothetical protein